MKKHLSTILLVMAFLLGLSVLLYPTISDWWNSSRQSKAIIDYETLIQAMSQEDYAQEFAAAQAYNDAIKEVDYPLMNYEQVPGYLDTLSLASNGVMGYITIDKIGVKLPIYHGTSEDALHDGVGHVEGTSLPIGGPDTHAALSAHTGLPSAKLFSDLHEMKLGDTFVVQVLNRTMTYQVDQILTVLPNEVEELYVQPGQDLCTLITCTPYGINTHRLLVRGVRVENLVSELNLTNQAVKVSAETWLPLTLLPGTSLLLTVAAAMSEKRKRRKGNGNGE